MHDKPLAAKPFDSYRYRGPFGYIMIGAMDVADALREAQRSTLELVHFSKLERWDGSKYVPARAMRSAGRP